MAYKMYKQGETPAAKTGGIILVYGFPGVGKTSLGINAADVAQPLFYINCDRSAAHLLKNYDVELILQHFWANYGPWLRKQLTQWQLEILAEETTRREEG